MWKKVLVVGATTAAIVGAGTAALAVTGSSSPTPAPTGSSSATPAGAPHAGHRHAGAGRLGVLRRAEHGTLTIRDAKAPGGFETLDGIRGTVSAVSASSITVTSADKTVETYLVAGSTLVHLKADGKAKGSTGQIGKVQDGDAVVVLGTGTGTLTATHVLDTTR